MSVKVIVRKKEYDFDAGLSVSQILTRLRLQPEAYLVVRRGELLTEDIKVEEGDVIELVAVISGGSGLETA